jgi:hypothetical protein
MNYGDPVDYRCQECTARFALALKGFGDGQLDGAVHVEPSCCPFCGSSDIAPIADAAITIDLPK